MKSLSFLTEKGGVGKSVLTFNVAHELAKTSKVLVIDMDGQRANITHFFNVAKNSNLLSVYDVIMADRGLQDAIITIKPNLDLVPGTQSLTSITTAIKYSKFSKLINDLSVYYDYILIDNSPAPTWAHFLTLAVCDYVVIPLLPDSESIEGLKGIAESIEDAKATANPDLKVLGLLFNRFSGRTLLEKEILKNAHEIAAELGTHVLNTKLKTSTVIGESVYLHRPITDYAPKHAAAEQIRALISEIEKEM